MRLQKKSHMQLQHLTWTGVVCLLSSYSRIVSGMSLPAENKKSQQNLNSCQMQEFIQAHKDSGLKRLLNKY